MSYLGRVDSLHQIPKLALEAPSHALPLQDFLPPFHDGRHALTLTPEFFFHETDKRAKHGKSRFVSRARNEKTTQLCTTAVAPVVYGECKFETNYCCRTLPFNQSIPRFEPPGLRKSVHFKHFCSHAEEVISAKAGLQRSPPGVSKRYTHSRAPARRSGLLLLEHCQPSLEVILRRLRGLALVGSFSASNRVRVHPTQSCRA